jgi:hypothetical protein
MTAPKRRWPRFTLRTLFIVVTVFGCWLAYELNWIRERHQFLESQAALMTVHGVHESDFKSAVRQFGRGFYEPPSRHTVPVQQQPPIGPVQLLRFPRGKHPHGLCPRAQQRRTRGPWLYWIGSLLLAAAEARLADQGERGPRNKNPLRPSERSERVG